MGFSGISLSQLVIVLVIVALIFGTKRLRGIGTDLGKGLKSFREALKDEDKTSTDSPQEPLSNVEQTSQSNDSTQPKS